MQAIERIIPIARSLLTIDIAEGRRDLWLWERAERVFRLTQLIVQMPEISDKPVDRTALAAAGLFHCAAWVDQVHQDSSSRWQILARPTTDIQRELSAVLFQERAAHLLPADTARLAADAIRRCNDRATTLVEAQLLAEAENLDDLGMVHVLRQFRQYQVDGRPLRQITDTWERQKEYHYWEFRINDGLRFETTKRLARHRLQAVAEFMEALARDLGGLDVVQALEQDGANAE